MVELARSGRQEYKLNSYEVVYFMRYECDPEEATCQSSLLVAK
jgi:hypothetical protein